MQYSIHNKEQKEALQVSPTQSGPLPPQQTPMHRHESIGMSASVLDFQEANIDMKNTEQSPDIPIHVCEEQLAWKCLNSGGRTQHRT